MKKCIIVGAGEFKEKSLPYKEGDFLIAADGGLNYVESLGLAPDMVVGDFDSLGRMPSYENMRVLPVDKGITDMQAAVQEGRARRYEEFLIYGGCGGRIDHTIANLQMMAQMAEQGLRAALYGNKQIIQLIKGPLALGYVNHQGSGLSVFAYSPVCRGVRETGVKYRVEDYVPDGVFTNTSPTGVSNVIVEKYASVGLEEGILLAVVDRVSGQRENGSEQVKEL